MSDCLELQEFSTEGDQAFKSCENLLLKDSVLNEDEIGVSNDENVSGEICQDISKCHDLNCTDHSLHELVDALSNTSSPHQKPNFLDMSLDDIPLTEANDASSNDLLRIIPENMPDDKLLLLKIPEELQDSELLNDILDIELDQSILDEIEKTVRESEGAFVYQPDEETVEIIRRPPLQLVQQVIKFPAVKNGRVDNNAEDLEKTKKRKQHFQFPREDLVEFYSDEENNENSQNQAIITVNDDGPPSPKKVKLEESIIETPIIDENSTIEIPIESPKIEKKEKKKSRSVVENCPRCDKSFKKLSLHKCRGPIDDNGSIKKLKPSDVPLPTLKCESCKSFFPNMEALEKHQADKHSRLTCKVCKKVMKNAQGLKIHSAKCGIDIQPVKKFTPRYDRKKEI